MDESIVRLPRVIVCLLMYAFVCAYTYIYEYDIQYTIIYVYYTVYIHVLCTCNMYIMHCVYIKYAVLTFTVWQYIMFIYTLAGILALHWYSCNV